MKHGVFIAVQVFQIHLIYGVIIGFVLASGMVGLFRSFFAMADRAEARRKCPVNDWNWRANGIMHANKNNPWHVGINDVLNENRKD